MHKKSYLVLKRYCILTFFVNKYIIPPIKGDIL